MEIRSPKVLEKTPEVWGFNLGKVAVIVLSGMGLLFIGPYSLKTALVFPLFGGVYFLIDAKFPAKGELLQFISYNTGNKCIHCKKQLKKLTKKQTYVENLE